MHSISGAFADKQNFKGGRPKALHQISGAFAHSQEIKTSRT